MSLKNNQECQHWLSIWQGLESPWRQTSAQACEGGCRLAVGEEDSLTMGSIVAELAGQEWITRGRQPNTNIYAFCFLNVAAAWPIASNPCCCAFPAMMDCIPSSEMKGIFLFLSCFFQGFCHRRKKNIRFNLITQLHFLT